MDKVALIHERDRLEYLYLKASEFTFGSFKVVNRGHGLWAVKHNESVYNAIGGDFEWEPMPSSRTDDFLAATRFTRNNAIELAEKLSSENDSQLNN